MAKDHFKFNREQPITSKRPKKGFPPGRKIDDITSHGQFLLESFTNAKEKAHSQETGYDERLLFKIEIDDIEGSNLESIPGVELISQEKKGIFLVFSSDNALEEFEARLTSLASGGEPTRKSLLEALSSFDTFTPEDRTGWALANYGIPESQEFNIDVELWPLGNADERQALINAFEVWLKKQKIVIRDKVSNELIIIYRISATPNYIDLLLNHRDVRLVDLPPKFNLDLSLLHKDIQDLPIPPPPSDNAPGIVVLDSGITTGHPLLKSAIGDA